MENIQFFGDLEIGERFSYIIWNKKTEYFQECLFTKSGKTVADCDETNQIHGFNYNDCVMSI